MFTSYTEALPQKKRALQGRRLVVVVDIENVAGGAVVTEEMAECARTVVKSALNVVEGEQVVIGISHIGLFNAKALGPALGSGLVPARMALTSSCSTSSPPSTSTTASTKFSSSLVTASLRMLSPTSGAAV